MDDVRAVMDAAGSERAALLGSGDGAALATLFAATYPDRTAALILNDPVVRGRWASDYPWGSRGEPDSRRLLRGRVGRPRSHRELDCRRCPGSRRRRAVRTH